MTADGQSGDGRGIFHRLRHGFLLAKALAKTSDKAVPRRGGVHDLDLIDSAVADLAVLGISTSSFSECDQRVFASEIAKSRNGKSEAKDVDRVLFSLFHGSDQSVSVHSLVENGADVVIDKPEELLNFIK